MNNRIRHFRLLLTMLLALVVSLAPLNSFAATSMATSMKMENCHENMNNDDQMMKIPNCCSLHFTAMALPIIEVFVNIPTFKKDVVFTDVKQLTSNLYFYEIEPPRTTNAL